MGGRAIELQSSRDEKKCDTFKEQALVWIRMRRKFREEKRTNGRAEKCGDHVMDSDSITALFKELQIVH